MNNVYSVREIKKIENKNIKLGKSFKYGDNYHLTNIYYIDTNTNTNTNTINNINNTQECITPQTNNTTNTTNTTNTPIQQELAQQSETPKQRNVKYNIPHEYETKKQGTVDEKTKLIIQTPLMYIPNSIIYFNEKPFLELSFKNEEHDNDVLVFKKWIIELENYVYNLIKRRTSLNITKDTITSVIKKGYYNKSDKLLVPVNINISKCILIDDNKKNKILFNWDIPVPTYAISIIWIKNIWVKNNKWGINLFMYATRVMNSHILDPINFMGCDLDNKNIKTVDVINKFHKDDKMNMLVCNVPEYATFYSMLKMGIPKNAIKQKMMLLGINTNIIDYPANTLYITVLHYISNPGTSYNIDSNNISNISNISNSIKNINTSSNTGNTNLLTAINSGNLQLKKINLTNDINNSNSNIIVMSNKLQNINLSGLKVPSLIDIQTSLSKLKKVKQN